MAIAPSGAMKVVIGSCLLAALCSCSASDDPCPAPDSSRWTEREPGSYVYEECGTGFVIAACTIVAVQDGRVVATYDVDETDDVEPATPEEAGTLSDGFGPIDCSDCDVEVSTDAQWGFVNQRYTDCGEEGWGWEVRCFEPDTLDPEACR